MPRVVACRRADRTRGVALAAALAAACACRVGCVPPLMAQAAAPATRLGDRSCRDTLPHMVPASRVTATGRTPRARAPVLAWREGPVRWAPWSVQLGERRVPVLVVVVRFHPSRVALALDIVRDGDRLGGWSVYRAPHPAMVAFNAGQFTDDGPWGWVVHRGREWQAPGAGALAASIVVDTLQRVHIVPAASMARWRSPSMRPAVVEAVQSYPQLLAGGRLPVALCRPGHVDRTHRDIRLALGVRPDGEVVVALTRYAPSALPPQVAERLPIGPTTLEMAEIMHRLGAADAVMLDGGLSAQLVVRGNGAEQLWPGLRDVPLALVGMPR